MSRRSLLAIALALALVQSGCAAPARPTVEELRKEYPLYEENPLVQSARSSLHDYVATIPTGVLATITDHQVLRLMNQGADGSKAVPELEPLAFDYERYTLLVDTVIFGENPGSEIDVYLPVLQNLPLQNIDRTPGNRFFYGLARYPSEKQRQLETLLVCNGIPVNRPVFIGGSAVYWTRQGYMLSAWPGPDNADFDLMTKAEFIKAIRTLREKAQDKP